MTRLPAWRTNPSIGCRDLQELEPVTRAAAIKYIADAKKIGYTLIVTDTVRTLARQMWLWASGRTRPGLIVTKTLDSVHLYRRAFDVVVLKNGVARYDLLEELHKKLPPSKYGLELLPWEQPHMQIKGANGANQRTSAAVIAKQKGYKKAYG
jgi:peptidoglycan LD-endopeptidase CwlK